MNCKITFYDNVLSKENYSNLWVGDFKDMPKAELGVYTLNFIPPHQDLFTLQLNSTFLNTLFVAPNLYNIYEEQYKQNALYDIKETTLQNAPIIYLGSVEGKKTSYIKQTYILEKGTYTFSAVSEYGTGNANTATGYVNGIRYKNKNTDDVVTVKNTTTTYKNLSITFTLTSTNTVELYLMLTDNTYNTNTTNLSRFYNVMLSQTNTQIAYYPFINERQQSLAYLHANYAVVEYTDETNDTLTKKYYFIKWNKKRTTTETRSFDFVLDEWTTNGLNNAKYLECLQTQGHLAYNDLYGNFDYDFLTPPLYEHHFGAFDELDVGVKNLINEGNQNSTQSQQMRLFAFYRVGNQRLVLTKYVTKSDDEYYYGNIYLLLSQATKIYRLNGKSWNVTPDKIYIIPDNFIMRDTSVMGYSINRIQIGEGAGATTETITGAIVINHVANDGINYFRSNHFSTIEITIPPNSSFENWLTSQSVKRTRQNKPYKILLSTGNTQISLPYGKPIENDNYIISVPVRTTLSAFDMKIELFHDEKDIMPIDISSDFEEVVAVDSYAQYTAQNKNAISMQKISLGMQLGTGLIGAITSKGNVTGITHALQNTANFYAQQQDRMNKAVVWGGNTGGLANVTRGKQPCFACHFVPCSNSLNVYKIMYKYGFKWSGILTDVTKPPSNDLSKIITNFNDYRIPPFVNPHRFIQGTFDNELLDVKLTNYSIPPNISQAFENGVHVYYSSYADYEQP